MKKIVCDLLQMHKFKESDIDVTTKATIWYLAYNILAAAIPFFSVPIFVRIQSTNEYGLYNIFQSWSSIFLIFGSLYLDAGVFSNGMVKYKNREAYLSSMIGICTLSSISFLVIILTYYNFFSDVIGISKWLVALCVINNYFIVIQRLWGEKQKFEYKFRTYVIVNVSALLLITTLSFSFMYVFNTKSVYRIYATVIGNFFIGSCILLLCLKKSNNFCNRVYWKFALSFNLALVPHYIAYTLMTQIDRIMIDHKCGKESVAIYSLACSIGTLVSMIVNSSIASLSPILYQLIKEKKFEEINIRIKKIANIIAVLTMLFCLGSPEMVQFIGTPKYEKAKLIIPIVCSGYFINFFVSVYGVPLFYFEKKTWIVLGSCTTTVLNIILNYFAIMYIGYIGAVYTTLICSIVYALINYFISRKIVLNQTKCRIYGSIVFIKLSIYVISISLITLLFEKNFLIRVSLGFIIICFAIFKLFKK